LGVDIFEVIHVKSNEKIYVSLEDIREKKWVRNGQK
jgi:phenylpyruvate tautomerase PptA (4-oxalocrotonate tautomerase family)